MKLAILGNGFDLHHGLNTSFDNFREWCIKDEGKKEFINKIDTIIKNGEKDSTIISWAEFEGEFQNLYLIFKELRLFNINSFEGDIWFSPYKGLKINSYTFWDGKEKESLENIEEYFIEDKLLSREGEVKLSKLIKLLEGSLEELSNNFSIYFDEYMKEQIIPKVNNLKKYKQIQDILSEVDYIITFNYTNVHKIYGLKDVFTIHGEINDGNSLIIGFYHNPNIDVPEEEDDHLIRHDGRFFSKDTIHYRLTGEDIFEKIDNFIDNINGRLEEIIIIGFSLGETDRYVMNKILECKNIDGYKPRIHKKNISQLPSPLKINILNYNTSFEDGKEKIKHILGDKYIETEVIGTGLKLDKLANIEFNKIDYDMTLIEEASSNNSIESNKIFGGVVGEALTKEEVILKKELKKRLMKITDNLRDKEKGIPQTSL